MLGKNFSRWHFEILFLHVPGNRIWHFMLQIVSLGDNLHEMLFCFLGKIKYRFVVGWLCPNTVMCLSIMVTEARGKISMSEVLYLQGVSILFQVAAFFLRLAFRVKFSADNILKYLFFPENRISYFIQIGCMECQIFFSGEKKKISPNLLPTEN